MIVAFAHGSDDGFEEANGWCARHRGRRDLTSFSGAHKSPKFGRRVQESDGSTPVRFDHTIRV